MLPFSQMLRLLSLALILFPILAHADEWWAWTMLEMYRRDAWTGGVFLVNRLDSEDGAYVQMVSPRLKYQATSWLDLAAGLSMLSIENTKTHDRHLQFRPELETNFKFDLSPYLRLENRNRLEWRQNEGTGLTTHRARHRLQAARTFPKPVGAWNRVFLSNEWLFDLHRGEWTENRLVPLGLTFKTSAHTDLDLFYMIDSTLVADSWHHESVLGTYLRVRF